MKFSRIFLNTTTDFIRQSFKRISGILSYPESSISSTPYLLPLPLYLSLSFSLLFSLHCSSCKSSWRGVCSFTSVLLVPLGHRKDTRPRMRPFPSIKEKSYFRILSTRLEEHSLLRVFVTSCLQDSYFFAFSSLKEYRDEIILFAKINSLVFQ